MRKALIGSCVLCIVGVGLLGLRVLPPNGDVVEGRTTRSPETPDPYVAQRPPLDAEEPVPVDSPKNSRSFFLNDVLRIDQSAPGDVLTHEARVAVQSRDVEWLGTSVSCSCIETHTELVQTEAGQQAVLRMVWQVQEDALYAFVRGENMLGAECVGRLRDGDQTLDCRIGIETVVTPRVTISPGKLEPSDRPVELLVSRRNVPPEKFASCRLAVPTGVRYQRLEQSASLQRFVLHFDDFHGKGGTIQVQCDGRSWTVPFTTSDPLGLDLVSRVFLERAEVRRSRQFKAVCKTPAGCELEPRGRILIDDQPVGWAPIEVGNSHLIFDLSSFTGDESPVWNTEYFYIEVRATCGAQTGRRLIKCWWRK